MSYLTICDGFLSYNVEEEEEGEEEEKEYQKEQERRRWVFEGEDRCKL